MEKLQSTRQKITPFLWFDGNAEEAASFYTAVFKNSKINTVVRYGEGGPGPQGTAMTVAFELDGQAFVALNGGPAFKFTEAISFVVNCATQAEIDDMWAKLSGGGEPGRCGWQKDKFGLSWQIVPQNLGELLKGPDAQKSQRIMAALMQMDKIDISQLQKAAAELPVIN